MDIITKRIIENFKKLSLNFSIVDIEGHNIFSTTPKQTSFDVQALIKEQYLDIFELKQNQLLSGYVILHDKLSVREKDIIQQYLVQIHDFVNREHELVTHESKQMFWKNVLYGNIEQDQLKEYMSKFNIAKSSRYAHALLKITPELEIKSEHLEFIQRILKQYIGDYTLIHAYAIGLGEVVILLELSLTKESALSQIKKQFKVYDADIIKQLKSCSAFQNKSIILGLSESEYYIEELSVLFLPLLDFIRTAYQLHPSSRVILYENDPMYMLLNHIPSSVAAGFVERVLKKLRAKNNQSIESLQALFNNDLNVSRAAQSLGVHRHTLEYRLHIIQKETEADPLKFNDALEFALAILLKELYNL